MTPIERWAEAIDDVLRSTVDASTYPDGPCIDREYRANLRAVLAEMRAVTVVDGAAAPAGDPERLRWMWYSDVTPMPVLGERPALLILLPETSDE